MQSYEVMISRLENMIVGMHTDLDDFAARMGITILGPDYSIDQRLHDLLFSHTWMVVDGRYLVKGKDENDE